MSKAGISPLKLAYYKGLGGKHGAVQFHLQRPHYYCPKQGCRAKDFNAALPPSCPTHKDTEMVSREGCVFIDITSATGPNVYDWDKKIVMSFSITDMSAILYALSTKTECKILHDPGAKSERAGQIVKQFNMSALDERGCIISCSQKVSGQEQVTRHTVPMSPAEIMQLRMYLQAAMITALAWD